MAETFGLAVNIATVVDLLVKVGVQCSLYCSGVKSAPRDVKLILNEADRLTNTLGNVTNLLKGPEGEKVDSSQNIRQTVKDCAEQLKDLAAILEPGPKWKRLVWPLKKEEVAAITEKLGRFRSTISFDLQVYQASSLATIHQEFVLARLRTVERAGFDAHSDADDARCYPGTRTDILDQISTWGAIPDNKHIFWLNGQAGTGKSTISRTAAQAFCDRRVLGASFFFKRGEGDRGRATLLFPTIVAQLVHQLPSMAPYVRKEVDSDPSIHHKPLKHQFEKLLLEPILKFNKSSQPTTMIIVLDALDECDNLDDIKLVIYLLSQLQVSCSVRLKILVTSRPELPIQLGFKDIDGNYEAIILQEIPQPVIKHDITVFLKHDLAEIRRAYNRSVETDRQVPSDWPGADIQKLVNMAIPLFILAATICRSLRDRRLGRPQDQLQEFLYQKGSRGSNLDDTYLPVVERLWSGLTGSTRQKVIVRFKHVVGSIVLLANPLSKASLARLLGTPLNEVEDQLDLLHSVLSVPLDPFSPVRMLHLSFREFLIDPEKGIEDDKHPFWVDERQTNHMLATKCLRLLSTPNVLKKDICNLEQPGVARADVAQQTIDKCLPPEVQYACQYWVLHWKESKCLIQDGDGVTRFLARHLLQWLEALSIVGRISESLGMISDLLGCLSTEHSKNISAFLHDTQRLILGHRSAIDQWPLQIYFSAIIFAPQKSIIRNMFSAYFPNSLTLLPQVDLDWNACLATLEGHSGSIESVAFSPDSQRLASSDGRTVKLWDPRTGACTATLEGRTRSVAFSPDSQRLASGSYDGTVELWDTTTGACTATLEGHGALIISVAFSPDSQRLASGSSDQTVKLWDTTTGACTATLKGHGGVIISMAFSPDSQRLASGSDDGTIKLWDKTTGACTATLEAHGGWIMSVAFSPDSQRLAFGRCDESSHDENVRSGSGRTVGLWDTTTGAYTETLESHGDGISSVAFSPDSQWLASGSYDKTIKLWDTTTGACTATLEGHDGPVQSVVFSPDSQRLASGSKDKTVKLWDATTGTRTATLECHRDEISSVAFLPDSQRLASESYDNTVKLWDITTRACTATLEGHRGSSIPMAFSPDSKRLASGSSDKTIKLWDITAGTCTATLEGHRALIISIAFSPDSQRLASGSYDQTVKLWDTTTGACTATLKGHGSPTQPVAFSSNSKRLASGSYGGTIKLWDTTTGACTATLEGHNDSIESVAFSPDSQRLASGSDDGTIKLWDKTTGACTATLEAHDGPVQSVAFSPDSQRLASGSMDKTVKLWDPRTGACTATFDVGQSIRHLSFGRTSSMLHTDAGVLKLDRSSMLSRLGPGANLQAKRIGIGLSNQSSWVVWDSSDVIWLPPAYRGLPAVMGSMLAVGAPSGRVYFLRISPE